jgi:mRNA-degrading endonuclease RelE of RelBE toxin-antitoxin system
MPHIVMTDEFVASLADLDAKSRKRVTAFLDRIAGVPDAARLDLEIVHDAGDRAVRSMRVSSDLRAIAVLDGDHLVLIHVAHHDEAYSWARTHCIRCHPLTGALEVVPVGEVAVPPDSEA